MSEDTVAEIQALANDERGPAVWRWWADGVIDAALLAELLPHAWQAPASPRMWLDESQWVVLFRAAGFISEIDTRCTLSFPVPPSGPVEVWRGAPTAAAVGMSWAPDMVTARTFFAKWRFRGEATLYRTVVEATAILAVFATPVEQEVVVDPAMIGGLEVCEVGTAIDETADFLRRVSRTPPPGA